MKTTGSERAAAYLFRSCSGAFIRFRAREQHSPKNERLALKPVDYRRKCFARDSAVSRRRANVPLEGATGRLRDY